jgi:hypothetical protein
MHVDDEAQFVSFPPPMQKVCAVCAATFACGGPACWCARIQLTPESLRALREQYNGCLCPECLQKQARSSSPH